MDNKLIITRYEGGILSALYSDKTILELSVEKRNIGPAMGEITIGRVDNIVKNINASFVEIAEKTYAYLPLGKDMKPIMQNEREGGKLHIGDELVVQVERESMKTKLPSVTEKLTFTGKYAVLTHGKAMVGISSKIKDSAKRDYLKEIFEKYAEEDFGFIVRTNAQDAEPAELEREISRLVSEYKEIREKGIYRTKFSKLKEALPNYICELRDTYAGQLSEIITDDHELYEQIKAYLERYQPEDLQKLKFHSDENIKLSVLYSVTHRMEEATQKYVWLKSGGSLIIEPTETMTVIDVNTGKAIKGTKNGDEFFLKINLEAAEEIAHQLRLRNLSGMILVDFIDLESEEANRKLLEGFREILAKDPVKTTLVDMTGLHLVELTRKKVRKPLYEQLKAIRVDKA